VTGRWLWAPNRWIALALLLLGVTLVYAGIVTPFWVRPWQAQRARAVELQAREARVRGLLKRQIELPMVMEQLNQSIEQSPRFIGAADPEQGRLVLNQILDASLESVNRVGRQCEVTERGPAPGGDSAGQVRLSAHLRCGNTALLTLIATLQSQRPPIFIDSLTITTAGGGMFGQASQFVLDADLVTLAYLQPAQVHR